MSNERPIPTSQRLHGALSQVIASLAVGERMPSEPELARRLGVSRATLREAMRTFETQGMIHRRQGAGTYVARPSQVIESGLEVLESIETLGRRIGLPVSMGVVDIQTRPASAEESHRLGVTETTEVLSVGRVILAEGHPAAYLIDVLPTDVIDPAALGAEFSGSVLDVLLRSKHWGSGAVIAPEISRCEISAATATHDIARALCIQRGDVLLRFEALLFDQNGRTIDYSLSYFLPGHFRFHVVRRVGRNE